MERPIDLWDSAPRTGAIRPISSSVARSFGANGNLSDPIPGDHDPCSLHLGGFVEGRLVAVASVIAPRPGITNPDPPARLGRYERLPSACGTGIGAELVAVAERHARALGWTGIVLPAQFQESA